MKTVTETALSSPLAPGSIEPASEQRLAVVKGLARLVLARLRTRAEIGEATADVYTEALDDLDARDLAEAFAQASREEEWVPPPVVIRRYAEAATLDRKKREEEAHRAVVRREVLARKRGRGQEAVVTRAIRRLASAFLADTAGRLEPSESLLFEWCSEHNLTVAELHQLRGALRRRRMPHGRRIPARSTSQTEQRGDSWAFSSRAHW